MNKICTSLEQSQKLVELGIDISTSDMSWVSNGLGKPFARTIPIKGDPEELCACWSLAALLEYLRKIDLFPNIIDSDDCILMDISFYDNEDSKVLHNMQYLRVEGKTILDTCYAMIMKLHELNLI